MSKILITGGAGFIGTNLAEHMEAQGNEVLILDKRKSKFSPSIRADVTKKNWHSKVGKPEIIYHLAAIVRVDYVSTHPFETMNTEIMGINNVIKFAERTRPEKIIFSSTSAVYGTALPNQFLSEDIKTFPITSYATAKIMAEHYLKEMKKIHNIDFTVLRYFNAYGKYQDPKMVIARFMEAAKESKPIVVFNNGEQTRDFTYIDDVMKATELVAFTDKTNSQIINVGTGVATKIRDVALLVKKISGSQSKILFEKPPEPREHFEIQRRVCDKRRLKKLIGFECKTTLSQGLKKLMQEQ